MTLRRFLLGLAMCVAVASGCSRSDPQPGQPRLLEQVDHRFADDPAPNPIVPVALTVERPSEKPASEAPPDVLIEQSISGAAALGAAPSEDDAQLIRQAAKALRTKLSVIAHNLANSQTPGFKRSRVVLEDCGYRHVRLPGAQDAFNNYAPTGISLGLGTRVQCTQTIFDQGEFETTNNSLDLAIDGQGFFQILDPTTNEFHYTRAGNFAINSNGLLVIGSSETGRLVQPQISLPITTINMVVSAEGNVSIQQFGQTQFSQIGQLQLAKFLNPAGLLKLGENLYQETLASGAAVFGQPGTNGLGTLRQNALERSNVNLDDELQAWNETERTLRSLERLLAPAGLAHQ